MLQQCVKKCETCKYWEYDTIEDIYEEEVEIKFCSAFFTDGYDFDGHRDIGECLNFPYPYPCNHYVPSFHITPFYWGFDSDNKYTGGFHEECVLRYNRWVREVYNK